jgi:hypothetical protein
LSRFVASEGIVVWRRTLRLRAQAEGGRTKSPVETNAWVSAH